MGPLTSSTTDDQVILSASDARELERLLGVLRRAVKSESATAAGKERQHDRSSLSVQVPRSELVARAQAVALARAERAKFFGRAMFGEPAWDMLLGLYIAGNQPLSVGKVVSMTGEPKTTALRWLDYLEDKRLIGRNPDVHDRRFIWVNLLESGRERLDLYFSSLTDEGRSVG